MEVGRRKIVVKCDVYMQAKYICMDTWRRQKYIMLHGAK